MKILISVTISIILAAGVFAQNENVRAEFLPAGVLQPTVLELPVPAYPPEAKETNLGGRVSVAVTIDAQGKVLSAGDADGPFPICRSVTNPDVLALRSAAIGAAQEATFKPAVSDSGRMASNGRIAYYFGGYSNTIMKEVTATPVTGFRKVPVTDTVTMANDKPPLQPQPTGPPPSETVPGSVLNGKALSLPRPPYPPAAKAVRATGAVNVQVLIYEDGTIFSAQATSGHPLLRSAAEIAACGSRFSPTLLEGKPVKVSGYITYNFVP